MHARWHRLLRVLVACLAFLVVAAPARAMAASEVVVMVAGQAVEVRAQQQEEQQVTEDGPAAPLPAIREEARCTGTVVHRDRTYLRLCVLLC